MPAMTQVQAGKFSRQVLLLNPAVHTSVSQRSPVKGVRPSLYATGIPISYTGVIISLLCFCTLPKFLSHRLQPEIEPITRRTTAL